MIFGRPQPGMTSRVRQRGIGALSRLTAVAVLGSGCAAGQPGDGREAVCEQWHESWGGSGCREQFPVADRRASEHRHRQPTEDLVVEVCLRCPAASGYGVGYCRLEFAQWSRR
jgi:hypothetical protein